MIENSPSTPIGYVVYNCKLNGYLGNDDYFVDSLAKAHVFIDEARCKTEIKKIASRYTRVDVYNEENMSIKKVIIKEAETTV